ncbi:MAG: tetratricopeptide repeat protein [Paludibacteraceae bacterium]|nr:tetratricopeptide repeat protein [Paludibacteraceae bacterium]
MAKNSSTQTPTEKEVTENVDKALTKTGAFIVEHKNAILVALAVVLLIVAGVLIAMSVLNSKETEAREQLLLGQNFFAAQNYETSVNGDSVSYIGFVAIADEYGLTKSGELAKVYAGLSYYRMGQYDEALDFLKKASLKDDVVKYNVYAAIGDCYVQKGDNKKAVNYFEKAAKADLEVVKANALFKLAKVYEAMGEEKKALEAYETIKTECAGKVQVSDVLEIDKYIENVSK